MAVLEAEVKQLRELGKVATALGLAGETGDPKDVPSEADARAAIESRIAQHGGGKVQLFALRKKDGQRQQFLQHVQYVMDVELAIDFKATGMWMKGFGATPAFGFQSGVRRSDRLEIIRSSAFQKF